MPQFYESFFVGRKANIAALVIIENHRSPTLMSTENI